MSRNQIDTQRKIAAVRSVASKLHAAEEAIDVAIQRLGELMAEMPAARIDASISATVGQEAFDRVANAMTAISQSRAYTVEAHESLHQTQQDMGLGITASGNMWKLVQRLSVAENEAA